MAKVAFAQKMIARNHLADSHFNEPYKKRLNEKRAIRLTENFIIKDCGNGYSKFLPINPQKRINGSEGAE